MATRFQVYKCELCGNIVEVLHGADGALSCCGKPMVLLEENTTDAAKEKHVPVIEKTAEGVTVTVGSVEHPMEEKHYIQWVEIKTDEGTKRRYLKPGEKPAAAFKAAEGKVTAREYCNIHGFWKSEV